MQEPPSSGPEDLGSSALHCLDQPLDYSQVDSSTDAYSIWNKFLVNHSKLVEETHEHHFGHALFNPGDDQMRLPCSEPHLVASSVFGIPSPKPGFISTDDMIHWSSMRDHGQRSPGTCNSAQFLSRSQQVGDPLQAFLLHLQILAQKSVGQLQRQTNIC